MTGAEIVALPGWKWRRGLLLPDGRIVQAVQDGVAWAEVYTTDSTVLLPAPHAVPAPADELLPGWLLHLLRERTGSTTHVHWDGIGEWDAWAPDARGWRIIGSGPTELSALIDAHRRLR